MNKAQQDAVTTAQLTLSMSAQTLTVLLFVIDEAVRTNNMQRITQVSTEARDVVASMRQAAALLISTGAAT